MNADLIVIRSCNDCWACRTTDGKHLDPGDYDQLKQESLVEGFKVHSEPKVREFIFELRTGERAFG